MSLLDPMFASFSPNRKSFGRDQMIEFVKASLQEIKEINDAYKQYFESTDSSGAPSTFADIEAKVAKIRDAYVSLFNSTDTEDSKIEELDKKIEEIRDYHTELLEGTDSIKATVAEAQTKIDSFYVYLFGDEEDNAGIHDEVKEAIDHILQSKKDITDFEGKLNAEIIPALDATQKVLTKRLEEAGALLSDVTVNTLMNGYAESKYEYSKPAAKEYRALRVNSWPADLAYDVYALIFNVVWRHLGFLLNYALFITPLAAVCAIFTNEQTAALVLQSLAQGGTNPSTLELIYVKTLISIPLIWVAWYGQRNISQRKRLYEEYNHKLRVVQMYLMFSQNPEAYPLDGKEELELALMRVIRRNPSEVFGRDETLLDKIAEVLLASKGIATSPGKIRDSKEKEDAEAED